MKGGRQPLGYTIVEVMIVLAITGLMFVIAASFIQGKQQKTSFRQGVNDYAAQIQGVIDDVTAGQYSDIPLKCTLNSTVPPTLTVVSSGGSNNTVGTNVNCTFLGKFINLANTQNSLQYTVMTIVGVRADPSTAALYSDTTQPPYPVVATSIEQNLPIPDSLVQTSVSEDGSTGNDGLGFLQGQGQATGKSYNSGAQTVSMYATSSLGLGPANYGQADSIVSSGLTPISTAKICLTDGTEKASITIGGQQQLTTAVQIGDSSC